MAFGDEYQNATNYPLVRITNNASGKVFYLRTHDHSTMGVATGIQDRLDELRRSEQYRVGAGTLVVVANGIASQGPLPCTRQQSPPQRVAKSRAGERAARSYLSRRTQSENTVEGVDRR